MIHVIATIEIAPGMRDDFLAAFAELVPDVRAEQGCIEYGPAIDLATSIGDQPAAAGKRRHRHRKMGERRGPSQASGSTPHDALSPHGEGHRAGRFDSGVGAGLIIMEEGGERRFLDGRFGVAADANSPSLKHLHLLCSIRFGKKLPHPRAPSS